MNDRTDLIDVHAHFLTDSYVAAAKQAGYGNPDGMPAWPEWSVDGALRLMDDGGIGKAYLSISSPGVHLGEETRASELARSVNDEGAAIRRAYPERFGHFASLPLPDVEASLAEAARALDELGADGVTFETNSHGVYLGDPRLTPLMEELSRREAVVFVHPTSPSCDPALFLNRPRPMFEFLVDEARTVSDLILAGGLARHPGIRWIFTHGGGVLPLLADRFEMFRSFFGTPQDGPTVHEQLTQLWWDMAGTPFPRQIPALVDVVGDERLLYGSDSCWTPDRIVLQQIASVDAAAPPANGGSWRTLTTRNAASLFS